ncbi:RHS repeat-associated core domain-containing protein [Teredinibacter haidensis]|uniref:RHS repeat-associated core domain-containing protein n=1 Tax=Teredinibacter haidensis TaxID=2731755 RepID=UPI000948FB02|nr:RHS repeat-associated core domain-containing protein [Teredinibacter haidensis]
MVEWTVFLDVIELNADIHRTDTYSNNTFQATDTIFIHADHLNTPRLATSQSQTKVWEWNSDVFGVGLANEDPDNDTNLTKINLRFPGQYFDGESGLHYNYFRDYDPTLGRYIQSDPIGLRGGINTYSYVNNNPLRYIDPYGLSAADVQKIQDIFNQSVQDMVNSGDRLDTSGFLGGVANNNVSKTNGYDFLRNLTGKNTLICGEQWDHVWDDLNDVQKGGGVDDNWDFTDKPSFGHMSGQGTSENPSDPTVYLDPWKNVFTTSK